MSLTIDRSALVWHSAERMRALVNDVGSYPLFLPWCANSEVIEQSDSHMVAKLFVSKGGVKQSFTTRNDISDPAKVIMSLVDGPFSHLSGEWRFSVLEDNASKVELCLNFNLQKSIAKMAFGPVFNQAANSMVDAFCKRANEVYGQSKGN